MIYQIITNTPWWVFFLFAYLVFVGFSALKPHVVPLMRMFIIPIVFTVWGLTSLVTKLNTALDVSTWAVSLAIGIAVGWLLHRQIKIRADKQMRLITLPGSPLLLILVLTIFAIKYFFGALYAINPLARANLLIVMADVISSGLITGVFVGRALCFADKYRKAGYSGNNKTD